MVKPVEVKVFHSTITMKKKNSKNLTNVEKPKPKPKPQGPIDI